MCFWIGEFTWSSCLLFQLFWFPPCAPGTCNVVPESWPGVCQKSSWSFVIGVIYLQFLRIFSFAISYQLPSFFFNFRIVTSGVTTACSPHHHMPHPHRWVHLTHQFIINPHFSEFIQTMKSAATPPPCRSTRNAKHALSSSDLGKAPPSSARATRTDKKKQTKTTPSTPIAPSPSGNLASLSPPLFFHSWIYCQ